jgi:outer membrane immunogenic protein
MTAGCAFAVSIDLSKALQHIASEIRALSEDFVTFCMTGLRFFHAYGKDFGNLNPTPYFAICLGSKKVLTFNLNGLIPSQQGRGYCCVFRDGMWRFDLTNRKRTHKYMNRFMKLNFALLAVALIVSPLALSAQSATPAKWSGVHIGVLGGAVAGNYNLHITDGTPGDTADIDASMSGVRLGVQGGIDFNVKGLVVGAVADWSWSDARTKINLAALGINGNLLDGKVKQMTTVRARVGKSYRHVLPYVHGGLLVADTELGGALPAALLVNSTSVSKVHSGFVVGGGVEYALSRHVSMTTEYAYNHVSGADITAELGGSGSDRATLNPHFSTLNVGFNYRF